MHRLQGWAAIFSLLVLCVLVSLTAAASGVEIEGGKLADRKRFGAGPDLLLNVAGVRTRFLVKVYVGALYLERRIASAEAVVADAGLKRVEIHMLRAIGSDQLYRALEDGLHSNHGAEQVVRMAPAIKQLESMFDAGRTLERGDLVVIEMLTDLGVRITVNGESRGTIPGFELGRTLQRIWLGERPADASLKRALLGG